MTLMTPRDRIAVAVIMTLVVAGWGVRYVRDVGDRPPVTVHRDAIALPAAFDADGEDAAGGVFAPIDVNTATRGELMQLPMIGPVKADAIIAYRRDHGGFSRIDDLTGVPGIGPATLDRIRDDITVFSDSGAAEPGPMAPGNEK